MQSADETRPAIRHLAERLNEPENYFCGRIGNVPCEPDSILFLRRDPARKIDSAVDADKLYHKRYALTINLETDGLVCINEKSFPLPENYATLVYPYQSHHYLVDQHNFFWLVVTFELDGQPPELMYRSSRMAEIQYRLLERMLHLYLNPGEHPQVEAILLQRYLGCLLLELGCEEARVDADHRLPDGNSRLRLFEEINGYIYQKLGDPGLSVEEIARQHYISTSFLYLLFNSMAGCNPGEYIRSIRIRQAQKMLDAGELLVSEVADRAGFSSLPIFSRCFRRVVGLSPSEYLRGQK